MTAHNGGAGPPKRADEAPLTCWRRFWKARRLQNTTPGGLHFGVQIFDRAPSTPTFVGQLDGHPRNAKIHICALNGRVTASFTFSNCSLRRWRQVAINKARVEGREFRRRYLHVCPLAGLCPTVLSPPGPFFVSGASFGIVICHLAKISASERRGIALSALLTGSQGDLNRMQSIQLGESHSVPGWPFWPAWTHLFAR